MSESPKNSISTFCFKVCGTCFVLLITFGIATLATRSSEVGQLALLLLIGTGISLVIGIIAAIWES